MSKKYTGNDDWKPCPQGTLPAFAVLERSRQRRRFLTKILGASAVALLILSGGYLAFGPSRSGEPTFGGVTCTTVRSNAAQYMAGKLDAQLSEQIRTHLEQCPDCQRVWREMSASMNKVSQANQREGYCGCSACQSQVLAATDAHATLVVDSGPAETSLALAR